MPSKCRPPQVWDASYVPEEESQINRGSLILDAFFAFYPIRWPLLTLFWFPGTKRAFDSLEFSPWGAKMPIINFQMQIALNEISQRAKKIIRFSRNPQNFFRSLGNLSCFRESDAANHLVTASKVSSCFLLQPLNGPPGIPSEAQPTIPINNQSTHQSNNQSTTTANQRYRI